MREHTVNNNGLPSLVTGGYIAAEVCDDLVYLFKDNKFFHSPGIFGNSLLNKKCKDSTDLCINTEELLHSPSIEAYLKELEEALSIYTDKYPWSTNTSDGWGITGPFNIQRYTPGQGFHATHFETGKYNTDEGRRHLAFMTYLTDVQGAGTYFETQDITFESEKGLTLIWPAGWTHPHRGISSTVGTKYIITGWYSFYKEDKK
jgi:hypothetical protein